MYVIIFLGKHSLALRGHRNEAMYEFLNNRLNNRGNFLELIKAILKFDLTMKTLIDKVVKTSEVRWK